MSTPRAMADAALCYPASEAPAPHRGGERPRGPDCGCDAPRGRRRALLIVGHRGPDAVACGDRGRKDDCLANKEILVMAGAIVMRRLAEEVCGSSRWTSEHNAIHQWPSGRSPGTCGGCSDRLGGPFRDRQSRISRRSLLRRRCSIRPDDGTQGSRLIRRPDEQGNGGHRGAVAVEVAPSRFEVWCTRSRSSIRWWSSWTDRSSRTWRDRLAVADSVRVFVSRALEHPLPRLDLVRAVRLDSRARYRQIPCLAPRSRPWRRCRADDRAQRRQRGCGVRFLIAGSPFAAISALIGRAMDAYDRKGRSPCGR